MHTKKTVILRLFGRIPMLFGVFVLCAFFTTSANADILESFNLAPFVPLVLEQMMIMATSLYDFFVGKGDGIVYLFIYAYLAFFICLYLVKMYFPKDWLKFIGVSDGGEIWEGNTDAWKITENVLKPCIRAIVAGVFLLQIKPTFVTEWLVNPFLEFGSIYTEQILKGINNSTISSAEAPACPASIEERGWITKRSCDFLVKPVYIISKENNKVIKYGFDFLKTGIRGMMTLIPHGGEDLFNIITGVLLLFAFISSNVFMALLIIQAIFDLCVSLMLYPINVLAWVAKKSDKWVDVLPAFSQIITALKNLIISMISCAFILCVNVAIVRALFNWSSSVFVVAAGGVSTTNVPSITNSAMNFGQHSILWLSALLTFFLMRNIFQLTRERLDLYTKDTSKTMYKDVAGDAKIMWEKIKATPGAIKDIIAAKEKLKK